MGARDIESSSVARSRRRVNSGFRHQSRSIAAKRDVLSVILTVKLSEASKNLNGRAGLRYSGTIEWE